MLDRDTIAKLTDFFEPGDLMEYLVEGGFVTFEELLDSIDVQVEDALPDLEELMGVRRE